MADEKEVQDIQDQENQLDQTPTADDAGADNSPVDDAPEPIVLTPREEAIARGEDPDAIEEELEEDGSDGDADGPSADADEPSEPSKPKKWWRETDVELAKTYGLSEDELADFGSETEFLRAAKTFAKSRDAGSAEQQGDGAESVASDDEDPMEEMRKMLPAEAWDDTGRLRKDYFNETGDWDEQSMAVVHVVSALQAAHIRDQQELKRLREQTEWLTEHTVKQQQDQQEVLFHSALDQLNPEFYGQHLGDDGRARELQLEHQARRQKILEEVTEIGESIARRAAREGKQPQYPTWDELVRRAQANIFADEIQQFEKSRKTSRVANQSRRRRPVGGSAGSRRGTAAAPDPTSVEAIAADPEIAKFFEN